MAFNTGYVCLTCGCRRVIASLSMLSSEKALVITLKCSKCGSYQQDIEPLLSDLFDIAR